MRVREILASMEGAEKERERERRRLSSREGDERGAVKLSVSSGIEEIEGERRRERERGDARGLLDGDEASGSSWGMQRAVGDARVSACVRIHQSSFRTARDRHGNPGGRREAITKRG